MPKFNGAPKNSKKGEENRKLDNHGQTAAHGIYLVGFVEAHHLPVHLFPIAFVLFSDLGHLRLQLLHPFHGLVAFMSQWPKQDLDEDGQQDDGYPVIFYIFD